MEFSFLPRSVAFSDTGIPCCSVRAPVLVCARNVRARIVREPGYLRGCYWPRKEVPRPNRDPRAAPTRRGRRTGRADQFPVGHPWRLERKPRQENSDPPTPAGSDCVNRRVIGQGRATLLRTCGWVPVQCSEASGQYPPFVAGSGDTLTCFLSIRLRPV